jgi:hypothetical protein
MVSEMALHLCQRKHVPFTTDIASSLRYTLIEGQEWTSRRIESAGWPFQPTPWLQTNPLHCEHISVSDVNHSIFYYIIKTTNKQRLGFNNLVL